MSTSQHSVPYIPSDLRRCASYALRWHASNGQDKEKRDPGMQTLDLVECGTLPFGEKEMANARRPTNGCFDLAQHAVAFLARVAVRRPDPLQQARREAGRGCRCAFLGGNRAAVPCVRLIAALAFRSSLAGCEYRAVAMP